jgi:hypothetical protein
MRLDELTNLLDELSWDEQVDFEMRERFPDSDSAQQAADDETSRLLGPRLTPALLDALEREDGYLAWVLRLSPYVPGDVPTRRAQRLLHHADSDVRYWAARIMGQAGS